MSNPLVPGDRIRCVDVIGAPDLKHGRIYRVRRYCPDKCAVLLEGEGDYWYSMFRFLLHEKGRITYEDWLELTRRDA